MEKSSFCNQALVFVILILILIVFIIIFSVFLIFLVFPVFFRLPITILLITFLFLSFRVLINRFVFGNGLCRILSI